MSISASDALAESLQVLESEFDELEQEYRGDLQQQSILEDPESLSTLSEVNSDPDEPSLTLNKVTWLLEINPVALPLQLMTSGSVDSQVVSSLIASWT